ncbi:hypothetical protein CATMIT_01568, partial [Catenibacterium mitsuokai DSM 15897]
VVGVHEIQIARPGGADDRLAHRHALGQAQAEAFGAVQRHVHVGAALQRAHVGAVDDLIAHHDARILRAGGQQAQELVRVAMRVAGLDHQPHVVAAVRERAPERFDDRERILAVHPRIEIEAAQEHEGVLGQAEVAALQAAVGHRAQRQRHPEHRLVGDAFEGFFDELG